TSLSICTSIFISRVFISLSPTSSSLGTFSFNPFADHPPLPSFPTRRSSDLAKLARHVPADAPKHHRVHAFLNITQRLQRDGALRSEEHTSELQSPYDLVCRLLLEKKKQTRTQRT